MTTQNGREFIGWANYYWTACDIAGVVSVGKYQLAAVFTFSDRPEHDYEKVQLQ